MASKSRRAHRRSWGSVTEVKRGRKYVIRWTENAPQGRTRRSKTVHGTYRDACTLLAQKQVEHANDVITPTFAQAYNAWYLPWLDRTWPDDNASTKKQRLYSWNKFCKEQWGGVHVDQVHPLEVQKWLDAMTKNQARVAMLGTQ